MDRSVVCGLPKRLLALQKGHDWRLRVWALALNPAFLLLG